MKINPLQIILEEINKSKEKQLLKKIILENNDNIFEGLVLSISGLLRRLPLATASNNLKQQEITKIKDISTFYFYFLLMQTNGIYNMFQSLLLSRGEVSLTAMNNVLNLLILNRQTQDIDIKLYFDSVMNQLFCLLVLENGDPKVAKMASFFLIGFLSKKPALTKSLVISRMLYPLRMLFEEQPGSFNRLRAKRILRPNHETDLDGNIVLVFDEQLQDSLRGIQRLLVGGEPLPELLDLLFEITPSIVVLYQFGKSVFSTQLHSLLNVLFALHPKPEKLLFDSCTKSVVSNSPFIKNGVSGGIVLTLSEAHQNRNVLEPSTVMEIIKKLDPDLKLAGDLFILLVESNFEIKKKNEQTIDGDVCVFYAGLILEMLDTFGDGLLQKKQQILTFVKSSLLDDSDVESVSLGLTLLCQLLSDAGDDEKVIFSENEFRILKEIKHVVIQLLKHDDENIASLSNIVHVKIIAVFCRDSKADQARSSETHSMKLFKDALKELGDELLPIRAHGMSVLRGLVISHDIIATRHLESIMTIFVDLLHDQDSFIYLNAIKGCSALAEVYPLETLSKLAMRYKNEDYDNQDRLRIGESLLQIIQRLGKTVIKAQAKVVLSSVFKVFHSEDLELKTSAIVLCSQIVRQEPEAVMPFIYQLFDYILGVLQFEKHISSRRAIILLLYELILSCGYQLPVNVSADVLTQTRDRIRDIAQSSIDVVAKGHAERTLKVMNQLFLGGILC